MIEVLNWVFQDAWHFFGILVLMMAFFNGLASVVGAASNRKPIGTDSNPSKD
jgi:hypothetical protein